MFEIIETNRYPGLELVHSTKQILITTQAWQVTFANWETIRDAYKYGKLIADGGVKTCGLCALSQPSTAAQPRIWEQSDSLMP